LWLTLLLALSILAGGIITALASALGCDENVSSATWRGEVCAVVGGGGFGWAATLLPPMIVLAVGLRHRKKRTLLTVVGVLALLLVGSFIFIVVSTS
jgi:hypothetical protein